MEAGKNPGQQPSGVDPMTAAQIALAEARRKRLVVRGISKHGRNGFGGLFAPGKTVLLEREATNANDPNAVKVLLADGSMLGYVAREMAGRLSRELAEGWQFQVRIGGRPYVDDKWGQCELEVIGRCQRSK